MSSESQSNQTTTKPEEKRILGMDRTQFKIGLGATIALLAIIFVLQNTDDASIKFFGEITMPRIILYSFILAGGALLGWIIKSLSLRWKK